MDHVYWPAVYTLLFTPPIVPAPMLPQADVMFDLTLGGSTPRARQHHPSESHLREHVARHGPRCRGVHVTPPRDRCLVFDVDLRDQPGLPCRETHDRRTVCLSCWAIARRAVADLDRYVRRPLGIAAPPLVVYSGANGVHVWYALASAPPEVALAMNNAGVRDRLVAALTARSPIQFDAGPTRIPELDAATGLPTKFGHTIRLPLSRHTVTQRVTMPLDPDTIPFPLNAQGRGDERPVALAAGRERFIKFVEAATAPVALDPRFARREHTLV